ncbi:MAG: 16S rRNA (guanine(527)-N(7))-methyltransferase RsmG [Actinomycetota bacterium]|nr:16S rRNA (guanine(527)-N(7))-methyltransferase RsmG [Actinomycetota bacterium]
MIDAAAERPPDTQPGEVAIPPAPESARAVFGPRLAQAEAYVSALAADGVVRGLIGPHEVPRLWERHLLNCAVVADLIPDGARVIDVGSGAGLPGIPLALARPDLAITLLEPLARRTIFLDEVTQRLGLDNVDVVGARADEWAPRPLADVVTARAVAPLGRLAGWCLPLLLPGGRLLAIKGASAAAEMAASVDEVSRAGGRRAQMRFCGAGVVDPPATVVDIARGTGAAKRRNRA